MKSLICCAFVCVLEIFVMGTAWASPGDVCVCPEPSSMLLFIVGIIGIVGYSSKRKSTK
ncbi:PEP-CTERM sorting domain-containing protein [bacterium]|nr:PEP-CTERM sorting domain-containing protein [bacterium]